MALPAILGAAARLGGRVASAAGPAALSALKTGGSWAYKSSGASNVPIFDSAVRGGQSAYSTFRGAPKKQSKRGSGSNDDPLEQREDENRERQEKAHEQGTKGLGGDEGSTLKIISRDIKEIRDGITLIAKREPGDKEGGGIMDKLGGLLTGAVAALGLLPGKLIGSLTKILPKALAGPATKLLAGAGGLAMKTGSRVLGPLAGALGAGGLLKAGAGSLGKSGAEAGAKVGGGLLAKVGGKALGKSLIKKIPIVGALAGLGFGIHRAMAGDWTGAGLEVASGLASTVPGVGTAASIGIDAGLAARDMGAFSSSGSSLTPSNPSPSAAAVAASSSTGTGNQSTVSPTYVMMSTLQEMLALMTDSTKGIYTRESSLTPIDALASSMQPAGQSSPSYSESGTGSIPPTRRVNNPEVASSMTAIASHEGLGGLSAHYESGKKGSEAVGWDSTGGTSFGKYQIASKTGTMAKFLEYAKQHNPEVYSRLSAAGPADSGKTGAFAQEWKRLAGEGKLGGLEHDFIKSSHYDVSMRGIKDPGLRGTIEGSKALQDVLWSTSVQHGGGGGAGILNKVYRPGMSEEELIRAVYAERGTRFGSSTAKVRASVQNRFADEQRRALSMTGVNNSMNPALQESTADRRTADAKVVVVQAPTTVAQTKAPASGAQGSAGVGTPMTVRDTSSPIRNMNAALMAGKV